MRRLTTPQGFSVERPASQHRSAKSRLCRFVMSVYLEAYLRVFWAAYKEKTRNG